MSIKSTTVVVTCRGGPWQNKAVLLHHADGDIKTLTFRAGITRVVLTPLVRTSSLFIGGPNEPPRPRG